MGVGNKRDFYHALCILHAYPRARVLTRFMHGFSSESFARSIAVEKIERKKPAYAHTSLAGTTRVRPEKHNYIIMTSHTSTEGACLTWI